MFARDIAIGAPPTAALAREIWVPPLGPIPPRGIFISEAGDPHLRNRGPSSPKQGTRAFEHLGASSEQGIDIPKAGDRYLPSRGSMLQRRGPMSPEQIFGSPEQIFRSPEQIFGSPEQIFGSPEQIFGSPERIFGSPEQFFGSPEQVSRRAKPLFRPPEEIGVRVGQRSRAGAISRDRRARRRRGGGPRCRACRGGRRCRDRGRAWRR